MIQASLEEVISLANGWRESKSRLRLVASLKCGSISHECSILDVNDDQIGLRVSGQPRGIVGIRLANCEFYFGAEDIPESERLHSGFKLDTGISFITEDAESLWLLEIIEGPKPD